MSEKTWLGVSDGSATNVGMKVLFSNCLQSAGDATPLWSPQTVFAASAQSSVRYAVSRSSVAACQASLGAVSVGETSSPER